MTREQFDAKVREMRCEAAAAARNFGVMQNEVKEQIAGLKRQIHAIHEQAQKLEQYRVMLSQQRYETEKQWRERISQFISENQPSATRQLEDVGDFALVNELLARGYHGTLDSTTADGDHLSRLNAKLQGKEAPTQP